MPSEGGHAEFAPRSAEQREIQSMIQSELGYCEIESLLSGDGLERLYTFYTGRTAGAASISEAALGMLSDSTAARRATGDAGGAVDAAAATRAVRTFLSILGAAAGNLSLTTFAQGGVFIAGGITPKLLAAVEAFGDVHTGFLHKECRFSNVLEKMPLHVIRGECDIGLLGATNFAVNYM